MKHIIIINQYGAPGKYHNFKRTAEFAKRFSEEKYDVTVFCSSTLHNSKEKIFAKNEFFEGANYKYIKTISYNNNFSRLLGMIQFSFLLYFYLIREKKPFIIIASIQSMFSAFTGYFISKLKKCKFILEVRDLWPETLIQFKKTKRNSIFSIFFRNMERFIYKRADYIVPTMKNIEEYIKCILKMKKYPEIIPINNGVDYDKFQLLEKKYSYIFESKGFNCVYTGSIGFANNIDLIISTAEIALFEKQNINFHFFGEGNLKQYFINLVSEKKLKNVYFHSSIAYDFLPSLLKAADVLLLPVRDIDLYKYGLSMNKIFDYLSSKTPVISTTKNIEDDIVDFAGWISILPNNSKLLYESIKEVKNMNKNIINERVIEANNFVKQNYNFDILSMKYIDIFKKIEKDNSEI